MKLSPDHIDFIIKDLNYRGIVADEVQDELIDHICAAVETRMADGARFIDAYHQAIQEFGSTRGLRETQKQTIGNPKSTTMFKNYFTIAWRNMRKQSFYSAINIVGLATGVAACLVIILYVADELSYDKYNEKADRIYRVEADIRFGGNEFSMAYRPAPEAHVLVEEFPEVDKAIRFRQSGTYLVRAEQGTDNIKESYVIWADSNFFDIFTVNVLEGNAHKALAEPASVAISKRTAEKYFPGQSALGQSIILDNRYHVKVTAVYDNIPEASHFHFDIIVSMLGNFPICKEALSTTFLQENFQEYILLKEKTDPHQLQAKFPAFIEKHMGPEVAAAFGDGFTFEKFRASGNRYNLYLRPLTDIHLHSSVKGEVEPNSNINYIILMAFVAVFILVIGCINFMNLSTARSSNRAKEVGVRKVMGSLRSHLVRQFLTESFMITFVSFVAAIALAYLFLPVFNMLSQKQLQLPFGDARFIGALLLACAVISVLAGLYPSFFLSAFKPATVLKGNLTRGMKSGAIRSTLVVFQFVISIFLIVGALSIRQQLAFIQNKRIGFDKNQVMIVHDAYALRPNNARPFKEAVLKLTGIESGTLSGFVPVELDYSWRSSNSFWKYGAEASTENMVSTQSWSVDRDYISTMKMRIIKGRDFSDTSAPESNEVILNETAVKRLGLGDDPIGMKIHSWIDGPPGPDNVATLTVIGVVEDFHFSSMKETIGAVGFMLGNSDGSVCFRFDPARTKELVSEIEKIWKGLAPGQPFQYTFLNEDFARMYESESRLGTIFSLFAGLAIIVACLGLFALTAFTAEQRTKEIGIRKVLGASVNSIVMLLSREFVRLIMVAFILAAPVAWYAVKWWLRDYQYQMTIGWEIFAVAGLSAFVIAFITMSFQSVRAAAADPVKSLKSE